MLLIRDLERAHKLSNRVHLGEEDHMELIHLLEAVHDQGSREGYNCGFTDGQEDPDEVWAGECCARCGARV